MKSDIGIFGTKIAGVLIGFLGTLFGLILIVAGKTTSGAVIIIISLVIGSFLKFKAKRRTGFILYDGGKI